MDTNSFLDRYFGEISRFTSADYMDLLARLPRSDDEWFHARCEECDGKYKLRPPEQMTLDDLRPPLLLCPYCGFWGYYGDFVKSEQRNTLATVVFDTTVKCCGEYAIMGRFANCPMCLCFSGPRLFREEIAELEQRLADVEDGAEGHRQVLASSVSDLVALFDGYGRRTVMGPRTGPIAERFLADPKFKLARGLSDDDLKILKRLSFQDLERARITIKKVFSVDFASKVKSEDWERVVRLFKKRHLLAHQWGIVDARYKSQVSDNEVEGRAVTLSKVEVQDVLVPLHDMARELHGWLAS